jgi:hypothetical protein
MSWSGQNEKLTKIRRNLELDKIRRAVKKKVLNFGHWPNLCDLPHSQTLDTLYNIFFLLLQESTLYPLKRVLNKT